MHARMVREDQAEHLHQDLERRYHAFVRIDCKPYLTAQDRAELREALATSIRNAQEATQIMDGQIAVISQNLRLIQSQLVVLTTRAEGDLKTAARFSSQKLTFFEE